MQNNPISIKSLEFILISLKYDENETIYDFM